MASAGPSSGAYVMDSETDEVLFSLAAHQPADPRLQHQALHQRGRARPPRRRFDARHHARRPGTLREDGTWDGNLYLRGGGDPTFGTRAFNRGYGAHGERRDASRRSSRGAGFRRVTGHVYGDESLFDSRRGGPGLRLPDVGLGRPAQRAQLQPRLRPGRLPLQPARIRGRAARQARSRREGIRRARQARREGRPRRRGRAHGGPLADRSARHDPQHEQGLRQLLRRDADEGPRGERPARRAGPARRPTRFPCRRRPPRRARSRAGAPPPPLPGPATLPAGTRVAMRFARELRRPRRGSWTAPGSRAATGLAALGRAAARRACATAPTTASSATRCRSPASTARSTTA